MDGVVQMLCSDQSSRAMFAVTAICILGIFTIWCDQSVTAQESIGDDSGSVKLAEPLDILPMADRIGRLSDMNAQPIDVQFFAPDSARVSDLSSQSCWMVEQASMLQPTPFTAPRVALSPGTAQSDSAVRLSSSIFDNSGVDRSLLRQSGLVASNFSVDRQC